VSGEPGPGPVHADAEGLRYAEAMAELDGILVDLERDDLDVDELGAKVARAAHLIGWCRERIGAARMEVTAIIRDIDAG